MKFNLAKIFSITISNLIVAFVLIILRAYSVRVKILIVKTPMEKRLGNIILEMLPPKLSKRRVHTDALIFLSFDLSHIVNPLVIKAS